MAPKKKIDTKVRGKLIGQAEISEAKKEKTKKAVVTATKEK